jgi:hypothetical protein
LRRDLIQGPRRRGAPLHCGHHLFRALRLQAELDQAADGFGQVRDRPLFCSPILDGIEHLFREADNLFDGMGFWSTNHFAYV